MYVYICYMKTTTFKPSFKQYGSRKIYNIKRKYIILSLIILCIITPFTNWLIPFLHKIIKNDVRYVRFLN